MDRSVSTWQGTGKDRLPVLRDDSLLRSRRQMQIPSKQVCLKWLTKVTHLAPGDDFLFHSLDDLDELGKLLLPQALESCPRAQQLKNCLEDHWKKKWPKTQLPPDYLEEERDRVTRAQKGAELDVRRLKVMRVPYINAASVPSLVKACPALPRYVATQHPFPNTVIDFWRMVLCERPACIVMLNGCDYGATDSQDEPAKKCAEYWCQEAVGLEAGFAIQEVQRREVNGNKVVVRMLRLTLSGGEDRSHFPGGMTFDVPHVCVNSWLDQTAPSLDDFLSLWQLCQQLLQVSSAPAPHKMVVHCAGGIGRTGVFIALDMCARAWVAATRHQVETGADARPEKLLSPDRAIGILRSRRVNMVQTPEQYNFLHYALGPLVECLQSEITTPPLLASLPNMSGAEDEIFNRAHTCF